MTDQNLAKMLIEFYHRFDEWPGYQKQMLEKWRGLATNILSVKGYALAVAMIEKEKK